MKYIITVQPLVKPRNWVLVENFVYKNYVVPAGFEFDGCSIPFIFWWLFPHGGAKFPAACFHDWAYRTQRISKVEADLEFLSIAVENGESRKKALLMYAAVKLFGWGPWRRWSSKMKKIGLDTIKGITSTKKD